MKKISLILLFTVITTTVFAQAPNIQWQKSLGGTGGDRANSVQQTLDNGYVVAGQSNSNDGDVTGNHGGLDYWIVKLLPNGSIQWQKSLGGSSSELAQSIYQTSDSGYIVAGQSASNDGDVTGNHGNLDYWIVKLSSAGSLQWQKCLGGSFNDEALSIQQTTDGGYIVAGISISIDGDVTGNHGNLDYWVVKLNDTGGIQWQKSLGGDNIDLATSIEQTLDGGYIVAGSSNSSDGDVTGNHGDFDCWIVKLSSAGSLQWQKSLGGSRGDYASSIQQTPDSGYIVFGYSSSNDGDVTVHYGDSTSVDYWVVKLSSSGNIQWQESLGGISYDYCWSGRKTSDNGYILAGATASNDSDVTGNHGYYDWWVVKLSSTGIMQWEKCLGGSGADDAYSINPTSDSGYIAAGDNVSTDGDVTGNHGNSDYWVVKLSFSHDLEVKTAGNLTQIAIIPNPTSGNISITGTGNVTIKVYNTLGQLIKQANNTDNISIAEFSSGLYFVRVFNEQGQMVKQDKIIKE